MEEPVGVIFDYYNIVFAANGVEFFTALDAERATGRVLPNADGGISLQSGKGAKSGVQTLWYTLSEVASPLFGPSS